MSIYRGAGGSGDAVNDASSEATLVAQLAIEAQNSADAAATSETNAANSASSASSSASAASTSASNAATSATNASNSASSASTSATNAANSATAAQTAETNAETAETNAETAETNAETAASLAQEWATKLSTPVSGSDYSAKYNANLAATSATNASNSATAAAGSASTASAAADAALTALDNFDDRYLGQKSTAPTLDNDGNALLAGALYFNTVSNSMKVYTGSVWVDAYADGNTFLAKASNLSDLANAATARTNLGLGTAATTASTDYATAAQGTKADSALQPAAIGVSIQAYDSDLAAFALKTAPSGTVVGTSDTQTLTNKTIALGSNTVSGTLAQFNTAVTDADFASIAGTETLTNKTLTSPVVTGGSINNTPIGATTANTGAFTTLGATGVATFSAGTVSAPAITTTGDTNTGIFFPAADTIAFTEGGVESMRIDASGNLSIGSTTFNQKLTIGGINASNNTNQNSIEFQDTNANPNFRITGGRGANGNEGYGVFSTLGGGTMSERMRIDSAGLVGIGTTSPAQLLSLSSSNTTGTAVNIINTSSGGYNWNIFSSGSAANIAPVGSLAFRDSTNGVTRMAIDSSGNVQVNGYSSTGATSSLRVGNVTDYQGRFYLDSSPELFYIENTSDYSLSGIAFKTNGSERMRIDASGNLLFNTTTIYGSSKFNLSFVGNANSGIMINDSTNTNGATMQVFYKTGTLIGSISNNNNTGVLYNVTSDYRLKNNAVALTGAKDFVMALKPKAWDWKDDLGKGVGFLAHEFMEVAKYSGFGEKDAVDKNGNPVYQTIQASSTEVMANIVALIQEQQALIENLTTRLTALEGN